MLKIFLDTNFLMIPGSFGVDVFSEIDRIVDENYELIVLKPVLKELKKISEGRDKHSRAARIGLELVKNKKLKVLDTEEKSGDKAILKLIDENSCVATVDKELKRKIREKKIRVIYLKGEKHLEIE
jgi:rRNA-processing protein FCF1